MTNVNKKPNLVLIGMPGSGKSSFGRALAKELGRPFLDADDVLEEREGTTIADLFRNGEDAFREAETRTSRFLSERRGQIIACGGGVVERMENIEAYKRSGVVIFIDRSPEAIMGDVETEGRPLLKSGRERVIELYSRRIGKYCAADFIVENDGTEWQVLERLLRLIEEEEL